MGQFDQLFHYLPVSTFLVALCSLSRSGTRELFVILHIDTERILMQICTCNITGNAEIQQTRKGRRGTSPEETQDLSDDIPQTRSSRALPKSEESATSSVLPSNIIHVDSPVVKSHALTNPGSGASTPVLMCGSPEPEDPNLAYVRIKMHITNLQRMGSSKNSEAVTHLEDRLREVRTHYFFDEKDAENLYQIERKKADAQSLQAKLRGSLPFSRAEGRAKVVRPKASAKTFEPETESDFFGEDDGDSSEGMLCFLETAPSEVQAGGTTIHVRDMTFIKHGSTKLPKAALMEFVSKVDRHAVVTFNIISGSSRAKRASVRVRWHAKGVDEWLMKEDACHDEAQAEQYIATIALHALVFPRSEGFAGGSQTVGGSTFYRFFPPTFRSLWDNLEETRKDANDRLNLGIWGKLRDIVEDKIPKTSVSAQHSSCSCQLKIP